jgi:hypothetical protein
MVNPAEQADTHSDSISGVKATFPFFDFFAAGDPLASSMQ